MSGITWVRHGGLKVPTRTQGGGSLFPLGTGESCIPEVERGIWTVLRSASGPVTVQQLVEWFAERGLAVRDETVRAELRHMVMDHLLPIVTKTDGVAIARCEADLDLAQSHLRSRIDRIQERIDALDEIKQVYVHQNTEPIAKRWSPAGVPKMMLGLVMGKHSPKRRRVKQLAEANASRPATKIEVTS